VVAAQSFARATDEMECVVATPDATVVTAQSFARATEMAIMAGEVRTSTFMSAPVTATALIAIGCAVEPLRREARIGGDATGHACN
jgi:hypothetical protein